MAARKKRGSRKAARSRGRKIGLALAGGGPLGGIYEIGALIALNEAIEGVRFSEADVYVGVSAGALVASLLVAVVIVPLGVVMTLPEDSEADRRGT